MQVTLCVLKLGLAPTPRHVAAGCIDLLSCDQLGGTLCLLYSDPHHWCVCERNILWIKLPKWKNIFPLVCSRSQLTSLLLLSQSWGDAWRMFAGSTLQSGCGRIISTTDFSSPRTCQSVTAAQPRAVLETERYPMAEENLQCFPACCSAPHHFWCQDFPMHSQCPPLCRDQTVLNVLLTNTCRGSLPPWRCLLMCLWYQWVK